ncbi:dipeptidase [Paracraurococcus lichenis]|uniref:Dipeptidase n=1 Tax=Paracraurococcus lichenis TaxID=3064888 RepID=A0ABT9E0I1_9PROT|nr:dipeptidase [Paracraurococcus sp. LOR1-02]MDO9709651.1 dipeptidase [Paracraurococcus sp. LOR1-02]
MTNSLPAILAHLDETAPAARQRLIDWLRIPSISAQPAHAEDCRRAAEWVRGELEAIGFTASVRPTAGHPVVLGHHPGPGGNAPHLLFYGHYDVQPADPLELWTSPPFEPAVVEGPHGPRVVARGAVDDKGQCRMWLDAFRAWHAVAGGPPCRITVLIEGEEEVGSPSLDAFLAANKDALKADVAIISDTGMWDIDTPAITTSLRGMVYSQIDVKAASRDLHSGMYGGSARNVINLLTQILGELHDETGRIRIPGFYDGVKELTNAQRVEWDALGFDEAAYLGDIGLSVPVGEKGRSALERMWARPTADINGIWGGYTGEGSKTVIAAEAHAKLSCRLVPGQDPQKIAEGIRRFVADRLPPDCSAEVQVFSTTPGIEVPAESRWVQAARRALSAEYGRPAILMGCGGSIPVVESLKRLLGLDSLLVGFGLNDDQVHSPNEKFEFRCLHQGARSHARLLAEIAGG